MYNCHTYSLISTRIQDVALRLSEELTFERASGQIDMNALSQIIFIVLDVIFYLDNGVIFTKY